MAGQTTTESMGQASADGYRVHLDAFDGPLDLLLFLIRRAEVDVTDIPVSVIADQYMEHLRGIERIDIDLAGEFLVMAATLMEIKSRMLMPPDPDANAPRPAGDSRGDPVDPRAELVRQLLDYKKYRDAADRLDEHRREWIERFPAARAGVHDESMRRALEGLPDLDLDEANLDDLVRAFESVLEAVNFDRIGEHEVGVDDTPIELHAQDILDRLARDGRPGAADGPAGPTLGLEQIFEGRTRGQMIGLFLAMLELVRQRRIGVTQGQSDGAISVVLLDAGEQREDVQTSPHDAGDPAP